MSTSNLPDHEEVVWIDTDRPRRGVPVVDAKYEVTDLLSFEQASRWLDARAPDWRSIVPPPPHVLAFGEEWFIPEQLVEWVAYKPHRQPLDDRTGNDMRYETDVTE
jgi:hypothetical protein